MAGVIRAGGLLPWNVVEGSIEFRNTGFAKYFADTVGKFVPAPEIEDAQIHVPPRHFSGFGCIRRTDRKPGFRRARLLR